MLGFHIQLTLPFLSTILMFKLYGVRSTNDTSDGYRLNASPTLCGYAVEGMIGTTVWWKAKNHSCFCPTIQPDLRTKELGYGYLAGNTGMSPEVLVGPPLA